MLLNAAAKNLMGIFVACPLIMIGTKSLRVTNRDEAEAVFDLRYRATFWQRGTDFTNMLNAKIMDSVVEDRPQQMAAE